MGIDKVDRRAFTKTSVAAGAAAAFGNVLGADTPAAAASPLGQTPVKGAAPARPGTTAAPGRGGAAGPAAGRQDWREGLTIPAEYYLDPGRYQKDERYIAENLWLMVDHQSRIPNPGDYFVFEFGRGDNVILLRNGSGEIKAFHNVCRHRGSRLCRDDDDPRPGDRRLSVRQLSAAGNTPLFRCPYHGWTYDLDGRLIQTYGMQKDFEPSKFGLLPVHVKVVEGHILVNLSQKPEPPPLDETVESLREVGRQYGFADLKVGVRRFYPIRANWKLAIENFLECYHCGPAHRNLVTTHNWDYSMSPEQAARRNKEVAAWESADPQQRAAAPAAMGMGGAGAPGDVSGDLNPGFVTGSLDGKSLAPLLPAFKEWTHRTRIATTIWSTGYWQAYDDHVAVARFTPRDTAQTDCQIIWLVHPDAVEGKDFRPDDLTALWEITIREDIWIVENNHLGITSRGYGPGRYASHEGYPAEFIKWYMTEVATA